MKKIRTVLLILGILFLQTCVQPYNVENIDYDQLLVVDGLVTNEFKNHQVKLSYTSELTNPSFQPIDDAEIRIESSNEATITYSSTGQGVYEPDQPFAGEPGTSYQLIINLDGKIYQSDPVELTVSPEIDSIYWYKTRQPVEDFNENLDGMQFFIDSHDPTGQSKNYRYEWTEGYRNDAFYISAAKVSGDTIIPREDPISICYSENHSSEIILGTTAGVDGNKISELPVRFISEKDRQLAVRYSLLVRQYAISEEAFRYYSTLKESNESGGSLFDKQLGIIRGNLQAQDDPFEPVLGYFEVSGVSELRRFFSRREFGTGLKIGQHPVQCIPEVLEIEFPEAIAQVNDVNADKEIYYVYIPPMGAGPPIAYVVSGSCSHCLRIEGTSLTPPDYWIE